MQIVDCARRYSATDLVNFSACAHRTHLDLLNLDAPLPKALETEEVVIIQQMGFAHEARYWERLKREHGSATDLTHSGTTDKERCEATLAALKRGDEVLFQATFLSEPWVGHADFLIRVDKPSRLGAFSYEVADTKLARSSKAKFLVQLCLYSELLAELQGTMPRHMHVVLGNDRRETYLVDDYLRYFKRLKARFLTWVEQGARVTYPQRVDHCGNCRWRDLCTNQWGTDDHLNRVANISSTQIGRLTDAGVATMTALAKLPTSQAIPRIQPDPLQRLAQQARLQVESAALQKPVHEVLPVCDGRGFNRLPEPHAGDLFFDMEGDPLEEGGLEYLFGVYYFEQDQPDFKKFWAHSRAEERRSFEDFIDFVVAHLRKHPGAHVYHYAPYEPNALKRLTLLHGTRENEVDDLLRQHKLVDLYAVVREGLRVGEPSYSIKYLERFYSSQARQAEVKTAGASIVFYDRWKKSQEQHLLDAIATYNYEDVRSTSELRQWLVSIKPKESNWAGADTGGEAGLVVATSAAAAQTAQTMETYRSRLLDGLPVDRLKWTGEDRLRELLFYLLGFQRRADKPAWWAMFSRQDALEEDLLNDLEALAGLTQSRDPQPRGKMTRCWYQFPEQDSKLKTGDTCLITASLKPVSNFVIDEEAREVSFDINSAYVPPATGVALAVGAPRDAKVIQSAIFRFVDAYLDSRTTYLAGLRLLRRDAPRVEGIEAGGALIGDVGDQLSETIRVTSSLQESHLFIQGPPGAGKTYTGSHVIVELLRQGKRIGVTSNSHKAINNLLQGIERVATQTGLSFKGAKKSSSEESRLDGVQIKDVQDTKAIVNELDELQLVAGTAWLFSNAALDKKFDYLFIDEAGQVSLANLMAMATCANNLVLLGDQMQLGQPVQGAHPGESGHSTLEYVLQEEATISPQRGIFLKDTWRMHPDVCSFISDAVYSGRLQAEKDNRRQRLVLSGPTHPDIKPTGISFIPVAHDGCTQRSDPEAEVVRQLFDDLLKQSYVDRHGVTHQITADNVLVVAPYNLQVNRLKQVLPEGARVGTVDKFQGQEAEAVLVSMTTSSGEFLPRNIEFLFSKNRLNVAISRARCWVGVVASPRLLEVNVATPIQMALVNTLCWVEEYANQEITT